MEHEFLVKVNLPDDVTPAMMTRYIREVVKRGAGFFNPTSPLFNLYSSDFTVKYTGVVDLPKEKKGERKVPIRSVRRNPPTK